MAYIKWYTLPLVYADNVNKLGGSLRTMQKKQTFEQLLVSKC